MTEPQRWHFEAIGVLWQIDTREALDPETVDEIRALIDRFDRDWSRYRDDSLVARLQQPGANRGGWRLPEEAPDLFAHYRWLYESTEGRVSPLVGNIMNQLGLDPQHSLVVRSPIPAPAWEHAFSLQGRMLQTFGPVHLDVGAAGKGLLVDLVAAVIAARAPDEPFVVDASGDLVVRGSGPSPGGERIGLEHPGDPSRAVGVVELADGALAASAINRRAWGDGVHHVIDALTGRPVHRIVATWAVSDSAMVADGIATALFHTDPGTLAAHPASVPFDAAWITAAGTLHATEGFPGELFR